ASKSQNRRLARSSKSERKPYPINEPRGRTKYLAYISHFGRVLWWGCRKGGCGWYRDAIDYLGYYVDTVGSMIDEPGRHYHLSKRVLADRTSKAIGVRINCRHDQANRREPQMVEVAVPKTHPLFNLEGDDPCDIPLLFGLELVAKAYIGNPRNDDNGPPPDDLENPLAQLLLTATSVKNGEWVRLPSYRRHLRLGTILFVRKSKRDLKIKDIDALCNLIEEFAVPFMLKEDASDPTTRTSLLDKLEQEGSKRGISY
ncbi:hypothetical protein CDV36_016635, partial [Fusarium kuroshium]